MERGRKEGWAEEQVGRGTTMKSMELVTERSYNNW